MILRNAVRSGLTTIEGVDSGNANTPLFRGDPDGQAEMFNDGASVARSLGAAAGGLEANNTLTGAGFERVLTTGDLAGARELPVKKIKHLLGFLVCYSTGHWASTCGNPVFS